MINETLLTGSDNTTTARQLADYFGCNIRDVTKTIESERRSGIPICANSKGYFLAADREELNSYCVAIHKRASELNTTRKALLRILGQLPDRWKNRL